jgi:hypothetical protein
MGPEATEDLTTRQKREGPGMGHTDAVAERPTWIRPAVSILLVVGLGAVVLAGAAWLAVNVLPDSDDVAEDDDIGPAIEVVEVAPATPDQYAVQVDRCEVVDDLVEVGGRLENTSGAPQSFVVHLAVLFGDQLFDGQVEEIGVPTVPDGEAGDWAQSVGSVEPADVAGLTPACEVDRVGLGDELVD